MDTYYLSENLYIKDDKMYNKNKLIISTNWHKKLKVEIANFNRSDDFKSNYADLLSFEIDNSSDIFKIENLKNKDSKYESHLNYKIRQDDVIIVRPDPFSIQTRKVTISGFVSGWIREAASAICSIWRANVSFVV